MWEAVLLRDAVEAEGADGFSFEAVGEEVDGFAGEVWRV
jgi:hypothetical protein